MDKNLVRESFCQILNENPRIMLTARSDGKFKAFFCDQIKPSYLEKLEKTKADIDFLNGVSAESVLDCNLNKWVTSKSTNAKGMQSRNIISFDLDQKDNPDADLIELSETIARNNVDLWMVVHSGHGLHLHFALKTLVPLSTDKERDLYKALYRNLQFGLERELGGMVFDKGAELPARTMRIPLSVNHKDPESPIETKVLHLNPDARMDVSELLSRCIPSPLITPSIRQSDGLREKILATLNWEVVFRELNLPWNSAKRTGSGWLVNSPFRDDKKASMSLSDTGLFFDHGDIETKGDIITFWAKAIGKDYGATLKEIALGFGLAKPDTTKRGQARLRLAKSPIVPEKDKQELLDGSLALDEDMPLGTVDQVGKKRQENKKRAHDSDYEKMFDLHFGPRTEIDLLSGELVYKPKGSDRWMPCATTKNLQYLKSRARVDNEFYSVAAVEEYLEGRYTMIHHEAERVPRLLVDVPPWDGVDRIEKIVECLPLAELDHVTVYELFKDWGSKMWQRIYNPKIQNRLLLLKGAQNAGKDFLVDSMFSALEQYLVQLTISNQEKELFEIIASGVVMHISEYDRTNRTEVGLLKHIITAPSTTFRSAYARKAETRLMRASFVATSNDNKALRDATGSRRFIYVELKPGEQIKRSYPIDSPQILAQFKVLASKGFEASEESERRLAKILSNLQPEDFEDVICEEWEEATVQESDIRVRSEKAKEEMDKIAYRYKVGVNAIRGILRRRGYHKKAENFRYWCKVLPAKDIIEE